MPTKARVCSRGGVRRHQSKAAAFCCKLTVWHWHRVSVRCGTCSFLAAWHSPRPGPTSPRPLALPSCRLLQFPLCRHTPLAPQCHFLIFPCYGISIAHNHKDPLIRRAVKGQHGQAWSRRLPNQLLQGSQFRKKNIYNPDMFLLETMGRKSCRTVPYCNLQNSTTTPPWLQ